MRCGTRSPTPLADRFSVIAMDLRGRAYWQGFFLIQPSPTPERAIEADPVAWLREGMGARHAGLAAFAPAALAEYERCIAMPGSATSICED
jgi:haloacetate dehalogenase